MTSSVRASRRTTRARDRRALTTPNDGFSVVAPTRVTVPASTWGRSASCWVFENRWISSMNRSVRRAY
jgi:hypothetical protein